jgi:hypothetical protein
MYVFTYVYVCSIIGEQVRPMYELDKLLDFDFRKDSLNFRTNYCVYLFLL